MSHSIRLLIFAAGSVVFLSAPGSTQQYGARLGTIDRGGEVSYAPMGPGVLFGALDPAVKKWYVPQELFNEYRWKQWEYSNYARNPYQRYVNEAIEGDYFYDLYGSFVTHGWLIFNTSQSQPEQFGSSVLKSQRFASWFSGVIISTDSKDQHHYAMTISDKLRTTFTPMTFSKPAWDGVQFDYAADKYQATVIYSRLSSPGGSTTLDREVLATNTTSLIGGRVTAQVGDFATMGFTSVNVHQSHSLVDGFAGDPITGELTIGQNSFISSIDIVLRDDSPEDRAGGAAFYPSGSDIIITYLDGSVDEGKKIRFDPVILGGFVQEGFLTADGPEEIRLRYDFDSAAFINGASAPKEEIREVKFRLVLANDYQVWVTSSQQLNRSNEPVLLLVDQAEGNIRDNTNLQIVEFEYGLPTATQIWGMTMELREVKGFDFYGEYDLSYSYTKYPNPSRKSHPFSSGTAGAKSAPAWMVNVSRVERSLFFFGEAYSMDPRYTTRTFVTTSDGRIDYQDERSFVVELVEDNDDQDRFPDTQRKDWLAGDLAVFPGWDENNDFIMDFNQNDNRALTNSIPDYDEPFLRHNVDRPEFLFGIDLNNNLWIDRFENDEDPDYPYRKDHQGYNVYGGVHMSPDVRLTAGVLREELISSDRRNHVDYLLLTVDRDTPRWGRFRVFNMLKSVKDGIPNPLLQFLPNVDIRTGVGTKIFDPLVARDTWVNSVWVGHDYNVKGLQATNYFKYDFYHQRLDRAERSLVSLRKRDYFFGLINKASYRFDLGALSITPRWKSEYRKQTLDLTSADKREEMTEFGGVLMRMSVLSHTTVQIGIEMSFLNDWDSDVNDLNGVATACQFTNVSDYLGYRLITQVGMEIDRLDQRGRDPETTNRGFIAVYAGLE